MNLKHFKDEMLNNPEFKKEYERFDLLLEIQNLWIEFKINAGILKGKILGKKEVKKSTGIAYFNNERFIVYFDNGIVELSDRDQHFIESKYITTYKDRVKVSEE